MLDWLFIKPLTVRVTILGMVGHVVVRFDGPVRLRPGATVTDALRAAGRAAGADLIKALEAGAEPALLHNGQRLELPGDLTRPVQDGETLSWLMPMAGG